MSVRDILRAARRDLHREMSVPAIYLDTPSAQPIPVTVRLHTKFAPVGHLPGSQGYAEREEIQPRIIFLRAEVPTPRRGAVVSVEPGEAYRVDRASVPDDFTIAASVILLSAAETAGLPVPAVV